MRESIAEKESGESRWSRGVHLFESGAFERISSTEFIVANPKGGEYEVNLEAATCGCYDFSRNQHLEDFACKHLVAARLYANWLKKSARRMAYLFDEVA